MKVKKLLKVLNPNMIINFYKYGEFIGQLHPTLSYTYNPDLNAKIDIINIFKLNDGKPCLQVYLKSEEEEK